MVAEVVSDAVQYVRIQCSAAVWFVVVVRAGGRTGNKRQPHQTSKGGGRRRKRTSSVAGSGRQSFDGGCRKSEADVPARGQTVEDGWGSVV